MNSVYVDGIEASLNYSPEKSINRSNRRPQTFSTSWKWKGGLPFFAPKVRWFPVRPTVRSIFPCEKVSFIQSDAANDVFSLVKVHRSHRWLHWLRLNTERCFHHCHSVSKSQYLYNKKRTSRRLGEGDEMVHSQRIQRILSRQHQSFWDSNSRYIKPSSQQQRLVRGRSEILYPTGHNSARTTVSSSVSQVSVIAAWSASLYYAWAIIRHLYAQHLTSL